MPDLPDGFEAGPLYCFPVGDEGSGGFAYIPGPPRLAGERAPRANLVDAGGSVFLTMVSVWNATNEQVEAAKAAIALAYPNLPSITLTIVDLADAEAEIRLSPEEGEPASLGPTSSSGAPSYRTVFSEALQGPNASAAAAAFEGQSGKMSVTYRARLTLQETAAAHLTGDLAAQLKALAPKQEERWNSFFPGRAPQPPQPPLPTLEACEGAVGEALRAGQLSLVRRDSANAPASLRQSTEANVRRAVAEMLLDRLSRLGADAQYMTSFAINRSVNENTHAEYSIERSADVGEILAATRAN
jgi:hypothetical protein